MMVRRQFVRVFSMDIRDLVADNVDRVCARNEYGAGLLIGHGHVCRVYASGSTSNGRKSTVGSGSSLPALAGDFVELDVRETAVRVFTRALPSPL